MQDIFCVCHMMFIAHRPLDIAWDPARLPRLTALCETLQSCPCFRRNPIVWRESGMPA